MAQARVHFCEKIKKTGFENWLYLNNSFPS